MMTGESGITSGTKWYPKGHPRCAGVSGDPHLTTFDQLRFDMQSAGEFIAAKSLDDNFEIQVRLEPLFSLPSVSFATAVAARVGPHRVMISIDSSAPLLIDGNPIEIPDAHYRVLEDAGASVVRTGRRYSVVWPDGTNLHVDVYNTILDLFVLPAEGRDGRMVGVLGDSDGDDGGNDFRTRDGKALASPPKFETLHKVFAESWRISAKESLFDYKAGESTATFTLREHPSRHVTVNDLDPAVRAGAEQKCRAAGVTEPEALANCVYDFGFSGNEEFIASARAHQTPPEFAGRAERRAQSPGGVRIEAPSEGIAAHNIEVNIRGPVAAGYWLGFAPKGSAEDGQAANPYSAVVLQGGDQLVKLVVPVVPGDYELRYRNVRDDFTALRSQPFRSIPPKLTIDAPESAQAGDNIEFRLSGDVGQFMTLLVAPAGSPSLAPGPASGIRQGTEASGSIRLLNTSPGEYEIRCISNGGVATQVYARRKLTVR
jgi:hypothetical protein